MRKLDSFFCHLLSTLIGLYKKIISPFQYVLFITFGIECKCRFIPTCSEYALGCLQHYSLFSACRLITKRLLRCHPFCNGGFDPVPER